MQSHNALKVKLDVTSQRHLRPREGPIVAGVQVVTRTHLKAALLVFLISLGLRVPWAMLATVTPISDFQNYDSLAWNWLTTGRFGSKSEPAYRTPGYPGFLAAVYATFGHNWKATALAQAFLGAATSALVVALASKVVSSRASVLAGLLHALSPTALAYVPVLASENLAVPLTVSGMLCLAIPGQSPRRRQVAVAAAGIVFGLLLLVRPAALFFLPAGLLLAVWRPQTRTFRAVPGVVFLIGVGLVLAPWLIRNFRLDLGPATLATTGGVNLYMGNNSLARSGGYLRRAQRYMDLPAAAQDGAYRHAALRWIRENPGRYLGLCATRALRLVGTPPDGWAANYILPTAGNDAALVAADASERKAAREETPTRHTPEFSARNAKALERLRRLAAPLTLVAVVLSSLRWRSFAIMLVPALCYGAGLSLTFFEARFRELLNPLMYVPLAALLSDLFFGTRDLCTRPARTAKLVLALTATAASFLASATNLDSSLYKLSPYTRVPTRTPVPDVQEGQDDTGAP